MRKRKGFTLLELMLVMIIIAILVGGVAVTFGPAARKKAEQTKIIKGLDPIRVAAIAYYMENGTYATSTATLVTADFLDPIPATGTVNYTLGSDANGVWVQGAVRTGQYSGEWVKIDGAGTLTYSNW